MMDLIISGGQVLDGTGKPSRSADVGITGDRITALGDLSSAEARFTIHLSVPGPTGASGKIVCPGFIDAHSHSDTYLLIEPSAHSKIYQGITTEVTGNCGASAAPLVGSYQMPSDWLDREYPGRWSSVAEYRKLLEKMRPAPNVVLLIGHNTLRAGVAGYEKRKITDAELREMTRLLEKSLDEGGRGLSTGLIYPPGTFAPREELVELAKVAAKRGGILTSHMRNEGVDLIKAINEIMDIGRKAGVRVEISHLKTAGESSWALIDDALGLIENGRNEGLKIAADRYPYTASCTELDVIFPDWAGEGGREAALKRLRNPSDRARIRENLLESRPDEYWSSITIGSTTRPANRQFRGVPLPEVAERLGMGPVDAVLYLVESDELKTSAFFFGMSEENMMKILAGPYVMLGTDASLRAPAGPLSHDYPHPRAYGSFPRFLRMAIDGKTVPLPEAVRKMTSLPAEHFMIKDRGIIAEGRKADITVFDPATVRDKADYSNPHQLAEGIEYVIINGVLTVADGRLTGNRAGRML